VYDGLLEKADDVWRYFFFAAFNASIAGTDIPGRIERNVVFENSRFNRLSGDNR
jgi:hypothetical protein